MAGNGFSSKFGSRKQLCQPLRCRLKVSAHCSRYPAALFLCRALRAQAAIVFSYDVVTRHTSFLAVTRTRITDLERFQTITFLKVNAHIYHYQRRRKREERI